MVHSRSMTTQAHIRIPEDLHTELVQIAEKEERSLNTTIVRLLRRAVESYTGGNDAQQ